MNTYTFKANGKTYSVTAAKDDASKLVRAIQQLTGIMQYCRHLTGVIGESERSHVSMMLVGNGGGKLADPEGFEAERAAYLASIPTEIKKAQLPALIAASDAIFQKHCPVKDERETPEQHAAAVAERNRIMQEQEAKRKAQDEREAQLLGAGSESVTWGEGQMCVYLQATFDDSDMMTDYFHQAHYGPKLALGIVREQAETQALARSMVARYPGLAGLTWEWHTEKYAGGRGNYLTSNYTELRAEGARSYGTYGQDAPALRWEVHFWGGGRGNSMVQYGGYPGTVSEESAAQPEPTRTAGAGFTVEHDRDWTWVIFPGKPSDTVLNVLRSMARWSMKRKAWYITRHVEAGELAAAFGC